ncbi:MAG: hypothetical protein U0Y82_17160, partial [Thermoleophilia bacterium]
MPEVLRWAALAVPLVAALVMAFDNGGYFASTWGAWGAVLAGVLMLLAALVGTGVGGTPGRLAAAGLLGLAVWQAASAWWAEDGGVSQQVMGLTLVYATAIGIVMFALQDPRSLRWLSAGVLLVAVIPVAAAVGGRLLPGTVGHDTFARLTWPITYWNGLGALAAFTLVLAIGLGSGRSLPVPVRAAVLATMPLSGLALYLTLSRGAILVGLIAIVAMVALAPQRLNTVAVAALGLLATAVVAALAEHQGGLVSLGPPLPEHSSQGHTVAVFLVLMMAVCAAAGVIGIEGLRLMRAPTRRIAGIAVAVVVALALVAGWATKGHAQNPFTWAHHQISAFQSYGSPDRNNGSVE